MAKVNTSWDPLPHLPIEELEPNLWRVQGSLHGMALKRVMTLVRLADGRIVVHSAIALDDDAIARIDAWGKPAVLLVPNAYHRLDAPAWVDRYPSLEVRCPSGARRKIEEVVRVDGDYDGLDLGEDLTVENLDGLSAAEGVLTVRSPAGATLVFNDALFNMPHGTGMAGWFFRYVTASTGGPRVSRLFRWFVIKDRAALRAHLERLAETPDLVRIIVSHHRMITEKPSETLREVAATLA
jgi:hypothetical protein